MRGQHMVYIDQYGNKFYACTVKELCKAVGGSKARRMYVDGIGGKSYHTGYVIGQHWLTGYVPLRKAV